MSVSRISNHRFEQFGDENEKENEKDTETDGVSSDGPFRRGGRRCVEWGLRLTLTVVAVALAWWGWTQGPRYAHKYHITKGTVPATAPGTLRLTDPLSWRPLFRGVDLAKIEGTTPVHQRILVVRADLQTPGVRPTISQPDFVTEKTAYMINRRTSTSLKEFGWAVALGSHELAFPEDSFIAQSGLVQPAKVHDDLHDAPRTYTGTLRCDPKTFDLEKYTRYQGVDLGFVVEQELTKTVNIRQYLLSHPRHLGWGIWDDMMIGVAPMVWNGHDYRCRFWLENDHAYSALVFDSKGRASTVSAKAPFENVRMGVRCDVLKRDDPSLKKRTALKRQPQDAVGYSADRRFLYFLCADGEQLNASYGIHRNDLRYLMDQLEIEEFAILAGTGVATLAISDGNGGAEVLNRPTHADLPGFERPFVVSVGLYAEPLP